jgi:hypothetical protein
VQEQSHAESGREAKKHCDIPTRVHTDTHPEQDEMKFTTMWGPSCVPSVSTIAQTS